MSACRILIIDDDEMSLKNLTRLFQKEGWETACARRGEEGIAYLNRHPCSVILVDLVMEDISGLEVLSRIKENHPEVEVIIITGYSSVSTAIEAMKKGAFHYIEKPFRVEEVRSLVQQAMEKARLKRRVRELEARLGSPEKEPMLIGQSREMTETVKLLKQVAGADCNVLITGESGVGKELAARLIHFHGRRNKGKFLAINCGGFSEELLANELFGHEKDAFTGATSMKTGLLESASSGVLFLDEVGDMPLAMQVKLLRAIQEQEVIRVGGNRPIPIDVQIIAATHQDLKKAVSAGLFRQDLYFRLNVVAIRIPPLRERKKDLPLLVNFFLQRAAQRNGKKIDRFSEAAMKVLLQYEYPGNVRELENLVEHAVAMSKDEVIHISDLPSELSEIEVFSFTQPEAQIKRLKEIERDYIQWVLSKAGRNKVKAAKLLGINRASLWRHLKKYEIK